MPQAWYNQAEAYFCLHGVMDQMFWFYYVQWALTLLQKKLARDILSVPNPPLDAYELLKEQRREGPLQEAADHAATWR
jgi:hypothetical protein